jgi:hypothetical protein
MYSRVSAFRAITAKRPPREGSARSGDTPELRRERDELLSGTFPSCCQSANDWLDDDTALALLSAMVRYQLAADRGSGIGPKGAPTVDQLPKIRQVIAEIEDDLRRAA